MDMVDRVTRLLYRGNLSVERANIVADQVRRTIKRAQYRVPESFFFSKNIWPTF